MKKTNKIKAQSHLVLSVRLNQGHKYTENYTNTVSNRCSQSKEINAKMLNPELHLDKIKFQHNRLNSPNWSG